MKKKILTIASVCLILMLATLPLSCGEIEPTPTPGPGPGPTPGPGPVTPTPPPAGVQYGGTLRLGSTVAPIVLGYPPTMARDDDRPMISTCLEPLLRYNKEGELVPFLATDWKEDAEALTIILTLREGIKFHDGTDFNAEAVKWNLEQCLAAKRMELQAVESVDAIDDYTVRLNFSGYDCETLSRLTSSAGYMISPTAFEEHGQEWCENHPVGTGPFKFVSWEKDVSIKFERFADYWQEGLPYLDGVTWFTIRNPMIAQASFLAGEMDVVIMVDPQDAPSIAATGKVVAAANCPGELEVGLPDGGHDYSIWSNLKVRQAAAYAINRQAIADAMGYGYWEPAKQRAPEGQWYYNPDVVGYPYNPEKARELLAEAGYPDGFKTTLYVNAVSAYRVLIVTAIQGYFDEIGIDAEVDTMEQARFHKLARGGFEHGAAFIWNQTSEPVVISNCWNFFSPGAIPFKGRLQPPEFQDVMAQARGEPDFEKRKALVWEMQRLMIDKYCMLWPMVIMTPIAFKYPEVHGDEINEIVRLQWNPAGAWLSR